MESGGGASPSGGMARNGGGGRGWAMAAQGRGRALDEAVGRWVVLFYCHRAVRAFRAGDSRDFRQLRDILNAVLVRPLALEQHIHLQLRIVQLLSRLEENWITDSEAEQAPFESALAFLETLKSEHQLNEAVLKNLTSKIQETAVIACVKNQEFEKASQLLKTQMSQDPDTQDTRLALETIVQERNFSHSIILNFSFRGFQQQVLAYLEDYLDDSEPFLLQMAQQNLAAVQAPRLSLSGTSSKGSVAAEQMVTAETPGASRGSPLTSGRCAPRRPAFHNLSDLRAAFKALYGSAGADAAFSRLDETDWICPTQISLPHQVTHRRKEKSAPGSPSSVQKRKCLVTVSSLVKGFETACSCGLCAQVDVTQEPLAAPAAQPAEPAEPETPSRPRGSWFPRQTESSANPEQEEKDTWSEEDELFDCASSGGDSSMTSSTFGTKKQKWTEEETEWIRAGVKKYGEGNWKAISQAYNFKKRTPVMIKDRWRTMKKLGLT
ncbi:telomeric repeat-binding factor 2 [Sphaerodactylus townsendi]|nr:telomeric repeat-binding factor 2 [Sphaerodactylus townsendi]